MPAPSPDTSGVIAHDTSPAPAHSPNFPQEPAQSSKSWIKWAALALIIAAIAGGVLMANKMKALSGANSAPTASQANKDAMSPEDKAKADALVGPQGGNTASTTDTVAPLNDASSVTIAPAVQTPFPAVSNPTPQLPPPSVALPATTPPLPQVAPSKPAPAKVQPTKSNAPPSLNDLLD
ncbi:zinc ribbon domain-containing protein [Comamonas sp. Y33R10-2]|uniref:zinc ribbon domain-containing protein n=1 Tax=Comamonas sp. Y33R10-2 TaxID=2853257 RepID=UPI0021053239|nr:zinc ribbon domain-containing protein [Comamonas sp. Y33R10-2]